MLIPLFAFAEAFIGIGLFISGAILVAVATTLNELGVASLSTIAVLAALGAMAGDQGGFWIGRALEHRLEHTGFFARHQQKIRRAEAMIERFGIITVFFGRFVPAVRSLVPAIMGASGYPPHKYLAADIAACLTWSLALAGIVTGILEFL